MAATIDNRVAELERANAQLRRQLDACSAELKEARDQQTATAEVLQVINSSPGDLTPVFDAILDKGLHLCEAAFGTLWTFDSECFHAVALRRVPAGFAEVLTRAPYRPEAGSAHERLLRGAPYAQIDDAAAEASIGPVRRALVELGGAHTVIAVPLLKDGAVLGAISAFRQEVRLFTDKQIALLQNFAAQAVIAMKNARLLTETREALEQQTATAEVLQVINSSPGELAPVFDAVIENSMRLCEATQGHLYIYADGQIHAEALRGEIQFIEWQRRRGSHPVTPGSPTERALRGEQVIHIADATQIETYRSSPAFKELIDRSGIHIGVTVALRRDEAFLGTINVYRQEVRPFTDKQIALLQNFAAQAVIAMENARLLGELRERTEDLQESLEYQTATSDVLKVISHSGAELQPVFDTLVETAARICAADTAAIMRLRDGMYRLETGFGVSEEWKDLVARHPVEPGRGSVTALVALERRVVHIEDTATDPEYGWKEAAQIGRFRTALGVPLMRGDTPIGVIALGRLRVEPFTERQIELVRTFADQAVIAMENARLITETREALEQQTATAEVLQVINSSPGDLAPVFDGMLEKAMRLCRIALGALELHENGKFRAVAVRGVSGPLAELLGQPFEPPPESPLARLIAGEKVVQITDMSELARLRPDDPRAQAGAQYGLHTALFVPLRKDADLLGQIVAFRKETLPFSEKEIALLQNFAAQAVIAMENARLLTETREALEQQTATAEVLQVINSSPGDLAPVFDAMLERAVRLCEFDFSSLWTFDGTVFRPVARHGVPERFWQYLQAHTPPPFARVVAGERLVHIPDVQSIPALMQTDFGRGLLELGIEPPRSLLIVSLRKDDALLGVIVAYRHEVRPFSDKQIALLRNFAAQAVIAMENARLITETREALEQQTATAEVLQVINSSPGDLVPVFDAMLEKATTLCGADIGILFEHDSGSFAAVAWHGTPEPFRQFLTREPLRPSPSTGLGSMARERRLIHLIDVAERESYRQGDPLSVASVELGGIRTFMAIPLVKENELVGAFVIYRRQVRPFTDTQIALVQNFAAQAVIAMENARLLTETREALEQQTATAEVLQVINSSPGDLKPVFDAMLEKAMHLCGAAFGTLWTYDEDRFRPMAYRGVPARYAEFLEHNAPLASAGTGRARILAGERVIHVSDLADEEPYRAGDLHRRALVDLGGARTGLIVPLLKHAEVLGYIRIYRQEVRPFSVKQIALLQNFAAQAVIAMENARLLTEQREALERQAATAEVLGIIASSPARLEPVFEAMLANAVRICAGTFGTLALYDGEGYRGVAAHGAPSSFPDTLSRFRRPVPGTTLDGLEKTLRTVQLADCAAEPAYDPVRAANPEYARVRSHLCTPMIKDNQLLGAILIYRDRVQPFDDKQIELVENFAKQAVIAIENARLITETREALEQQTATAEVLQVINSSPGDLTPVFDAMLDKAMRLCEAAFGFLSTYDGEHFHAVALHGVPQKFAEGWLSAPYRSSPNTTHDRLIRGERVVHVPDLAADGVDDPRRRAVIEVAGVRSILAVPLRNDSALLGAIHIYRQEVRPFSEKQIALAENFAAQAVIAMENARLIAETREALEQQTATAEVLQVINSSPGDLAPVFDAMLERAMRLCGAQFGEFFTTDSGELRAVALRGTPPAFAEFRRRNPAPPIPGSITARILAGEPVIHVADVRDDDLYRHGDPHRRALVDLGGARTFLSVTLLKDRAALGSINIYRQEVRPFSDKQIALLRNFAAQAVIAMENARLITETREALEQQTATAEVLQVINSSPGDLAPVFDAILDKAHDLCGIALGELELNEGGKFRAVAIRGVSGAFAELLRQPFAPPPQSPPARLLAGEPIVQLADLSELARQRLDDRRAQAGAQYGLRTVLFVPLRKDEALLGYITAYRQEVRPFSDKQIALLQNFAAQAVIAMENARLLTETREALEQQTATAEILQVINSSPGDLAPVFDAMLQKALALCGAAFGVLWTYDGEQVQAAALRGVPPRFAKFLTRAPHPVGPDNAHGRLLAGEPVVHIADVAEDEAYRSGDPTRRTLVEIGGGRTLLAVPLRRDSRFLGDFVIYRTEVRPFSDKQIALLENFAAQAVIAMENARLLGELRTRTHDLQESLEYQTATSDVLKVISQSFFDLESVLQTVVTTAVRLCRADSATIYRNEGGEYRWAAGHMLLPDYEEIERNVQIRLGPGTLVGRVAAAGQTVQIRDAWTDPLYEVKNDARIGGVHTMLGVPLLREGVPIGVIGLARRRVEGFSEREIALVTTFADQAVIAIENARLFGELRERTAELGRSVEELKMLGEVGRAVSSTLDLRAVLSTILTASLGMTWATAGAIFRYIRAERAFRLVEAVGWDEALLGSVSDLSIAETETLMSEAALQRTPIQLTDLAELPSTRLRDASLAAGLRSVLIVPLVGPERIFGALVLQRREAGEFPAETVRLMQTLASQSVLAIQNARLFREIADKSEQLALASQHKSQFLANMSHELRTPLNAILGYAELLVDGIYGVLPEKAQGVLERVQNNGKHLLALINDVLDLAKIEAGQLALTLEDYALAEVVGGVVTATEPLAAAKGLKFTAIVQEGMPMAHGDARRVSQVLLNLAGNAIKFTDQGEVAINASAANGQFVLTVRDTGPGIADADQERIFGEFQQIDNSDTRKKGGTGLGLAISKRMVEMQGGMISVDSVLGAGSTFRVVLPVHVEPALEEAA